MNKINERLYMLSEQGVAKYIRKFLKKRNIKYHEIEGGGIYSDIRPNYPLFSSHMDMVGDSYDHLIPVVQRGNKLERMFPAVLGGDDRAGINMILELLEIDKETNFVFSFQEEVGLVGAKKLCESKEFIEFMQECSYVCVLDRKGKNDLIGTENYYCNKDLVKHIESFGYFKSARGVACDANVFNAYVPCVNLSVGYYNAHTKDEYLNIKESLEIFKNVLHLNVETKPFDMPEAKPVYKAYNYKNLYSYKGYKESMCEACYATEGFDTTKVVKLFGISLCKECIEEFNKKINGGKKYDI